MKVTLIISIVLAVSVVSVVGFIILGSEDNISIIEETSSEETLGDITNEEDSEEITKGESLGESFIGAEGSAGGSESSTETSPSLECKMQHIQYSLKNFQENIVCEENINDECVKLNALCSVDVYNLDANVTENFEIEYSLIDSLEEELDSVIIGKNVNFNSPEKFLANFTIQNSAGIDNESSCALFMKTIPRKEVCI